MEVVTNHSNVSIHTKQVYTPKTLEERFEKLRYIGSGGEGCIYAAKEKLSGHVMALKIANNNWRVCEANEKVAEIISSILKEGQSLHLTKIHEIFSVECLLFEPLAGKKQQMGFFDEKYQPENNRTFPRRAFLLELLDGDLQALYGKGFIQEPRTRLAFKVQILSVQLILDIRGVRPHEPSKYRNILYKQVGPDDVFEGNQIRDFDFWKYVFGKHEFYLPRMEYLIKLSDYDSWITGATETKLDSEDFFENYFQVDSLCIQDFQECFKKPEDPNAKVLEMYKFKV